MLASTLLSNSGRDGASLVRTTFGLLILSLVGLSVFVRGRDPEPRAWGLPEDSKGRAVLPASSWDLGLQQVCLGPIPSADSRPRLDLVFQATEPQGATEFHVEFQWTGLEASSSGTTPAFVIRADERTLPLGSVGDPQVSEDGGYGSRTYSLSDVDVRRIASAQVVTVEVGDWQPWISSAQRQELLSLFATDAR